MKTIWKKKCASRLDKKQNQEILVVFLHLIILVFLYNQTVFRHHRYNHRHHVIPKKWFLFFDVFDSRNDGVIQSQKNKKTNRRQRAASSTTVLNLKSWNKNKKFLNKNVTRWRRRPRWRRWRRRCRRRTLCCRTRSVWWSGSGGVSFSHPYSHFWSDSSLWPQSGALRPSVARKKRRTTRRPNSGELTYLWLNDLVF